MIEVGKLAYLKSTDEPCFVVNMNAKPGRFPEVDPEKFSGVVVIVRRPQLTDKGIVHSFDEFLLEELESHEDKEKRIFGEVESIKARFPEHAIPKISSRN